MPGIDQIVYCVDGFGDLSCKDMVIMRINKSSILLFSSHPSDIHIRAFSHLVAIY